MNRYKGNVVKAPLCPICHSVLTATQIETEEGDWICGWLCDCTPELRDKVDQYDYSCEYIEQPNTIVKKEEK
jgi:hypothetical protein